MIAVVAASFTSFSQKGGSSNINQKALMAAENAGCLADYNGSVRYQVTVLSSCETGGDVIEVYIIPNSNNASFANVRRMPLAKVTFYCNEESYEVECF